MTAGTKQYIKTKHSSTNLPPIQTSLKKTKGNVYQNFIDKRRKQTEFKLRDSIRTADEETIFSKSDTANCSDYQCKIAGNNFDRKTTYHLKNLPEI